MKSSKISILCQIKLCILFLIIIFTIYYIYQKYWKKKHQITEHFKDDNYSVHKKQKIIGLDMRKTEINNGFNNSLKGCKDLCDNNPNCKGFSRDKYDGTCWFKYSGRNITSHEDFNTYLKICDIPCHSLKPLKPKNEKGLCSSLNKCSGLGKGNFCQGLQQAVGDGGCNKYCKDVGGGYYRSDLGGCVKNYCSCPTDKSNQDPWFRKNCVNMGKKNSWFRLNDIPFRCSELDISNGFIYAVNHEKQVYKTGLWGGYTWEEVTRPWISQISIHKDYIYGVGYWNSVWKHPINRMKGPVTVLKWERVTGPWVKQIRVYKDFIYGIGKDNEVLQHSIATGNWGQIAPPWVSNIYVYQGYIYGVGINHDVWRFSIKRRDSWSKVTNPWVSYICVHNNYIYGIGGDRKVYKHKYPKGNWKLIADCCVNRIQIIDNMIYGIKDDGYVWKHLLVPENDNYSKYHKLNQKLSDPFKYDQVNYYQKRRDPINYNKETDDYGKLKIYQKQVVYPKKANIQVIRPLIPGEIIALWNPTFKRFMRMNGATGKVDSCCRHNKNFPPNWPWEIWLVVDGGGGLICLWNPYNRRFARMNIKGKVDSCCIKEVNNLPTGDLWPMERWQVKDLGDNHIALWNPLHKRFARMNGNGKVDSCCQMEFNDMGKYKWISSGGEIFGEKWLVVRLTSVKGCWKDTRNRAIADASRYGYVNNNYKNMTNAINKCQQLAASRRHKFFAIQDGGWCATSSDAGYTYKKYGEINKCSNGKGGPWANNVYKLNTFNIPQDCQLSNWSNWSRCLGNCLGGKQNRYKSIVVPQKNGGKACIGPRRQEKTCSYPCGRVYVLGYYGMGPWGSASARFFRGGGITSQWIWNIPSAASNAPVGITIPLVKIHYSRGRMRLVLRIAADDSTTVYLNGRYIGNGGGGWGGTPITIYCTVNNGRNIFQFNSVNGLGPAGLAVYAYNRDNGAYQFRTDGSWGILR